MKRVWLSIRAALVLAIAAALLLVLGFGLLAQVGSAQAVPPPQETPEATPETDVSATGAEAGYRSCGDCHLDNQAAWATGVHAEAFDRQSFQETWAAQENDPDCLICHTTDYHPATGELLVENVRCEACHGLTPDDHPPAPFELRTDAEICGDCHTDTFDEWQHSLHSSVSQLSYLDQNLGAIGCATCHNPHGQTLRFETVDGLCLNCHGDMPENSLPYKDTFVHVTHNNVDFENVDIDCSSCHMYNQNIDEIHQRPNHTMKVDVAACTDCHKTVALQGESPAFVDINGKLVEERDALQTQVDQLETELDTAAEKEQVSDRTNYVRLTQGLIMGLGIGIAAVWVLSRRGNGNDNPKQASGEDSSS